MAHDKTRDFEDECYDQELQRQRPIAEAEEAKSMKSGRMIMATPETKLTVGKLKEILAGRPDEELIHIGWKGIVAPAYHCHVWDNIPDEDKEGFAPIVIVHRFIGDMFE